MKNNYYEAPRTMVILVEVESTFLNGTNVVVGPEPEYPD